ncbi:Peroxiredoxin [Beggiatoa sp. PS]|nr:Peroxiredoxin [Beggiatoa sp. PS]
MQNKIFQYPLWISCILFSLMTSLAIAADDKVVIFQKLSSTTIAPDLSLFDLKNQSQQLSDYRGKVILLHFWATWCRSCLAELAELQILWEKLQSEGLVVIAVAEDSRKSVEAYIRANRFNLPVWIDQYGDGLRPYNVNVFPTTYLIGRTGYLEGMALGPRQWTDSAVFNTMKKLVVLNK